MLVVSVVAVDRDGVGPGVDEGAVIWDFAFSMGLLAFMGACFSSIGVGSGVCCSSRKVVSPVLLTSADSIRC